MFKVGIGPSSSHTVGPMKAGKQFVDDLVEKGILHDVTRIAVDVYGSLSLTGKGHHTDIAIIMGLAGNEPATVDIDAIPAFIRDVETCCTAKPITPSAVVSSLMKSTSAKTWWAKWTCPTRSNPPRRCSATAKRPVCRSPVW